jgi:hypothetical protein
MADPKHANGADAGLDATMTIRLDPPVVTGGATHDELILREPSSGAMRDAEKELGIGPPGSSSIAQMSAYKIAVVAAGARVNRAVIERARNSEVNAAYDFLAKLLELGRVTGPNLSPTLPGSGDGDQPMPGA